MASHLYRWQADGNDEWRRGHVFLEGSTRSLCNRTNRPLNPVPCIGDGKLPLRCAFCRSALPNAIDFAEVTEPA